MTSGTSAPRDDHVSHTLPIFHGILPASALDCSSSDLRSASIPVKRYQQAKSSTSKRKASEHQGYSYPSMRLNYHHDGIGSKKSRKHSQAFCAALMKDEAELELHQSICLNLSGESAEADLWILPSLEEWELDVESSQQLSTKRDGGEWTPLVERAVNSNRERLRRRLEGDGWDFVGGRYGEIEEPREASSSTEGSVDEEFDVVVLETS